MVTLQACHAGARQSFRVLVSLGTVANRGMHMVRQSSQLSNYVNVRIVNTHKNTV